MPSSDFTRVNVERLSREISVENFTCGETKLDEYLKGYALGDQELRMGVTHVARIQGHVISFFTLAADALVLRGKNKQRLVSKGKPRYKAYPAMKIARLASQPDYQGKGIATGMLKIIA